MGKIIRIKEGGLPKVFDAAKLRTNLQVGGNCLWIPKESVPIASKFITENGTYLAAAEGLHGYSTLSVNVYNAVTGRSKKNNNLYSVSRSRTNELIYKKMPTRIEIEHMPTKTTYVNGDTIDIDGIIVKAYDENYNLWTDVDYPDGIIPIEELIITPETANSDFTDVETRKSKTYDIAVKLRKKDNKVEFEEYSRKNASYSHESNKHTMKYDRIEMKDKDTVYKALSVIDFYGPQNIYKNVSLYLLTDRYQAENSYLCGIETSTKYSDISQNIYYNEYEKSLRFPNRDYGYSIKYEDRTVFRSGAYEFGKLLNQDYTGTNNFEEFKYKTKCPINEIKAATSREWSSKLSKMAWTAMYGDVIQEEQTITVSWKRPQDEEELITEYSITVNQE